MKTDFVLYREVDSEFVNKLIKNNTPIIDNKSTNICFGDWDNKNMPEMCPYMK